MCSPRCDAFRTHRAWRDLLTRRLRDEGAEPVAAAPAYELPTTPATVLGVASGGELEARCAETYAYVVANAAGADRGWAIEALTGSAVRQVTFGGSPGPFPGAADARLTGTPRGPPASRNSRDIPDTGSRGPGVP